MALMAHTLPERDGVCIATRTKFDVGVRSHKDGVRRVWY